MAQAGDKALIVEARKRFRVAKEASADQRKDFKESMRMTFGEQWDTATKTARTSAGLRTAGACGTKTGSLSLIHDPHNRQRSGGGSSSG